VDKLKDKLGSISAADTFSNLERESGRVSFEPLTKAIEGISGKFSVMTVAAGVAFGNLTSQIAAKTAGLAKNVGLGPLTQGFQEYSTNLNAIQTTLANTEAKGSTLKDVNKTLAQLNQYSDQTIYNFGEMAKNIGTFTAAGVGLDQASESIKGIANLAALSGSNSEKASGAMYQLSQAIASGKVNLQDWNSVVTAGIGGEIFQKALFNTGKAMGTLKDVPVGQSFEQWTKAGNTFRNSLSATQKESTSSTDGMKKAHTDAAKTISDAEKSAADSVESASERVKDAQSNAAEAVQAAADKVKEAQTSSAEAIQGASDKVREAQVGVGETARKSAEDVAAATKAQSDTIKQASEDVKSALDGVREARRRLAEAMKPPSSDELQAAADNLRTAQLDQADLSGAIADAQRDQTRAAQDLASAEFKLAHLKPDATADERLSAQRAVEDARKRVTDASDAQTRALLRQRAAIRGVDQAAKDLQTTRQKGSRKDPNVKGAQDSLTEATKKYKDAQIKAQDDISAAADRVKDAQKKASEDQIKAGQRLADAQKDQAKTIIDSKKRVADAQKDQAKTIIDSQKNIADAQKDQTKTIEDAQKRISDAHVTAAEKIKAAEKSIGGKADKGPTTWLTSDVLTNTLRQFTGDMSKAQLKAQGLTDEQIKAVQQTAKTAKQSATEVKTLGQVFSVAKEAIGTGWADTFALIFGNFGEAKKTFTELSQFIGAFIAKASAARNAVLGEWKALGGRTQLIKGIQAAFEAIMSVLKPIGAAFREIFPATTGKQLFELTKGFRLWPNRWPSLRKPRTNSKAYSPGCSPWCTLAGQSSKTSSA
jgi:tape measure domain-containing protein